MIDGSPKSFHKQLISPNQMDEMSQVMQRLKFKRIQGKRQSESISKTALNFYSPSSLSFYQERSELNHSQAQLEVSRAASNLRLQDDQKFYQLTSSKYCNRNQIDLDSQQFERLPSSYCNFYEARRGQNITRMTELSQNKSALMNNRVKATRITRACQRVIQNGQSQESNSRKMHRFINNLIEQKFPITSEEALYFQSQAMDEIKVNPVIRQTQMTAVQLDQHAVKRKKQKLHHENVWNGVQRKSKQKVQDATIKLIQAIQAAQDHAEKEKKKLGQQQNQQPSKQKLKSKWAQLLTNQQQQPILQADRTNDQVLQIDRKSSLEPQKANQNKWAEDLNKKFGYCIVVPLNPRMHRTKLTPHQSNKQPVEIDDCSKSNGFNAFRNRCKDKRNSNVEQSLLHKEQSVARLIKNDSLCYEQSLNQLVEDYLENSRQGFKLVAKRRI